MRLILLTVLITLTSGACIVLEEDDGGDDFIDVSPDAGPPRGTPDAADDDAEPSPRAITVTKIVLPYNTVTMSSDDVALLTLRFDSNRDIELRQVEVMIGARSDIIRDPDLFDPNDPAPKPFYSDIKITTQSGIVLAGPREILTGPTDNARLQVLPAFAEGIPLFKGLRTTLSLRIDIGDKASMPNDLVAVFLDMRFIDLKTGTDVPESNIALVGTNVFSSGDFTVLP